MLTKVTKNVVVGWTSSLREKGYGRGEWLFITYYLLFIPIYRTRTQLTFFK